MNIIKRYMVYNCIMIVGKERAGDGAEGTGVFRETGEMVRQILRQYRPRGEQRERQESHVFT